MPMVMVKSKRRRNIIFVSYRYGERHFDPVYNKHVIDHQTNFAAKEFQTFPLN